MEGGTLANQSHTGVSSDVAERALLKQISAGEQHAFDTLFIRYQPRLFRFIARMVNDRATIEELVDDVMLVVWTKAGSFAGKSKVSTWIFGIAYNKALKAIRRSGRELPLLEEPEAADPAADYERDQWVEKGLRLLSPEQRLVVELTFVVGFSYAEIATIAGCPENTVKTRMFHARRKLKGALPQLSQQGGPGRG